MQLIMANKLGSSHFKIYLAFIGNTYRENYRLSSVTSTFALVLFAAIVTACFLQLGGVIVLGTVYALMFYLRIQ